MTTNSRTYWAASIIGALVALAAAPSQAQEVGVFEPTPCPIPLPYEGEVEGETYDCGIVIVPENHEVDGGRTPSSTSQAGLAHPVCTNSRQTRLCFRTCRRCASGGM